MGVGIRIVIMATAVVADDVVILHFQPCFIFVCLVERCRIGLIRFKSVFYNVKYSSTGCALLAYPSLDALFQTTLHLAAP